MPSGGQENGMENVRPVSEVKWRRTGWSPTIFSLFLWQREKTFPVSGRDERFRLPRGGPLRSDAGTLRIFSREPTTEWTRTEYDDFPTCIDSRPGGAAADRGQARRLAAATFADPGAEYRPVPFWHLNGRLSSDEIVRQIEDAKNLAGFGGVTVLPVSPGAQHPTASPARAWSRLI